MKTNFFETIKLRNEEIKKGVKSDIKMGLVVQGGGMRGIYSMAALVPFEELGLRHAFDHIVGSSAGAINGIYLVSGQGIDGVKAYSDEISNKNFINPFRIRRIVDIDFLVDKVVKDKKKLREREAKDAFTKVHIALTDYQTGKPFIVTNKEEELDLAEVIRATSAMPILYNKVVNIKGRDYLDGGIVHGVPLLPALELDCTHILVVLTRKPDFRRTPPNFFVKLVESLFIRNYPAPLKKVLLGKEFHKTFNHVMMILENPKKYAPDINISVVYPSDFSKLVSRTTYNRDDLIKCALMARNDMYRFLELEERDDNPFG
jgi:predicted patatin/cPLA2 family phospholipase